jgi:tRNA modification GTPase
MPQDTIIAVATPPGPGGLGIVRLSGPRALSIAMKVFTPRRGRVLPGRPVLGALHGPGRGRAFDEAFLTYHKRPRSYTREDVVEISCHGSPVVLEEIVRLGVRAGGRPAGPGEFTLRAYLNGRLDIIQAGAVNDLVRAVSLTQARVSFDQLGGRLSKRIGSLRGRLVGLLAGIEAAIEFPDEGSRTPVAATARRLDAIIADVDALVAGYEAGRPLAEGVTLAIAGRANVGKSTLFNALLGEDRAIVTPYPGTTRDYLREQIVVRDAVFHLVDTAGLGRPGHPVEREGIRRSERQVRGADGVLVVVDGSRPPGPEDERIVERLGDIHKIIVINKIDKARRGSERALARLAGDVPTVRVSALAGTNIEGLKACLRESFTRSAKRNEDIVLHRHQKRLLDELRDALARGLARLREGHTDEIVAEELRSGLPAAGKLLGEIRSSDILEEVFGRFCVGK